MMTTMLMPMVIQMMIMVIKSYIADMLPMDGDCDDSSEYGDALWKATAEKLFSKHPPAKL